MKKLSPPQRRALQRIVNDELFASYSTSMHPNTLTALVAKGYLKFESSGFQSSGNHPDQKANLGSVYNITPTGRAALAASR